MPLKSGNSHSVVSSNIKELVKSGRPVKQSIAIALANKRKFKKMAEGGLVNDDFDMEGTPDAIDVGDEDSYKSSMPSAAAEKPEFMEEEGKEHRSIVEINEDGDYEPEEVANPREMMEAMSRHFAMGGEASYEGNVHNPKLSKVPMKDRFAMGGLVEDPGEIQDTVGAMPEEDVEDSVEDRMTNMHGGEASLGHSVRDDYVVGSPKPPKDLGISEEAMEVIRNKRLKRRYPTF